MSRNSTAAAPDFDIAIVGGGISGIYSGWRLMTADPSTSPLFASWLKPRQTLKVAVIEGSGRIGGRLLSARAPTMPKITCELGGMRYVSSQTLARSLIENGLKLPRHEQVVDQPQNLAYLRDRHLRLENLTQPEALPYALRWAEADWLRRGNPPATLIGCAAETLLPGVSTLTGAALRKFLHAARVDGVPLYQLGFWNLLARVLSPEAYQLAIKTIGYDCLGSDANAVDLIAEYFDFTPNVKYYLLDDGYENLPWQLEQQFRSAGGEVIDQTWVSGFDAVTLGSETGVEIRFHGERPSLRVRAVVLAMPKRAIRLLRPDGPVLDPARAPQVQDLLNAVEGVPLFKLFMVYPSAWWQQQGVRQGRSLTDLPLRQCYYWGAEPASATDPQSGHAAIMAYNDASSTAFWGGLRRAPPVPGDTRPQYFLGARVHAHGDPAQAFAPLAKPAGRNENPYRRNWREHRAPAAMVAEMHRQLMTMHGVRYAPQPIDAAYMDWGNDPYGGAVHFWNAGYRSEEVLMAMTQPLADFPCYVCGEAWSTNQTWIEGALQTAEIVLQKRFKLAPPAWITTTP